VVIGKMMMTFPCAHCNNLIAVEKELLGSPVPCPHCQRVVQAPLLTPDGPAIPSPGQHLEPNFSIVKPEEQESIFAEPEQLEDALFGSPARIEMPSAPVLTELPTKLLPPDVASFCPPFSELSPEASVQGMLASTAPEENLVPPASVEELESQSEPSALFGRPIIAGTPLPQFSSPQSEVSVDAGPSPASLPVTVPVAVHQPEAPAKDVIVVSDWSAPPDGPPSRPPETVSARVVAGTDASPFSTENFAEIAPQRTTHRGMRTGLFVALVLIPLISYSILATIAVVILYLRPAAQHPLEMLPDIEGELKGAKRQKQGTVSIERVSPDSDLPDKLRVALGQSIRLGDLEVVPQKIELTQIKILRPGLGPQRGIDSSLVLHLRMRNASRGVVFSPVDPYFDRRWKRLSDGSKPYTFLELGSRRLYGGAVSWKPGQAPEERESVEGQVYKVLEPGEELTTFVCTDPEDHVRRHLRDHLDTLLWRIHLRRGLVQVGDREVPATAVIGVQFSDRDIVITES
jgi:hypothetical protein